MEPDESNHTSSKWRRYVPKMRLPDISGGMPSLRGRIIKHSLVALGLVALLYYPLGALYIESIDDDPGSLSAEPGLGSTAIATAIALIDREVNENRWVSNDPFFIPGAILDNMPNFQQGVMQALWRFTLELTDQIGRVRGSSAVDKDLEQASGLLKYPPDVWLWNPEVSLMPIASSESQYRAAQRALQNYNLRLQKGEATFEKRSDNLLTTLDRIAADIGSASAQLEQHIADHAGDWIDMTADDVFYNVKGRLYAYGLVLRALGVDFTTILRERDMQTAWDQTVESFLKGAVIRPLVVMNGTPDALLTPNHLAIEGFYLLRARTQLRELTNILQR